MFRWYWLITISALLQSDRSWRTWSRSEGFMFIQHSHCRRKFRSSSTQQRKALCYSRWGRLFRERTGQLRSAKLLWKLLESWSKKFCGNTRTKLCRRTPATLWSARGFRNAIFSHIRTSSFLSHTEDFWGRPKLWLKEFQFSEFQCMQTSRWTWSRRKTSATEFRWTWRILTKNCLTRTSINSSRILSSSAMRCQCRSDITIGLWLRMNQPSTGSSMSSDTMVHRTCSHQPTISTIYSWTW